MDLLQPFRPEARFASVKAIVNYTPSRYIANQLLSVVIATHITTKDCTRWLSSKRYPEEFEIEAVKQVTERGYPVPT